MGMGMGMGMGLQVLFFNACLRHRGVVAQAAAAPLAEAWRRT